MQRFKRTGRGTQWAWLITTLALGVALILSAWANQRGAGAAAGELTIGHAQIFKEAIQSVNRPGNRATPATLDSLVRAYEGTGLRFVALYDGYDSVVAIAGTAMPVRITIDRGAAARIEPVGDRIRGTFPAPLPGPRPGGPGWDKKPEGERRPPPRSEGRPQAPHGRPGPWPGDPREHGPQSIVLEFEPTVSRAIVARAERVFGVSAVVGVTLMLAGVLLWRMQRTIQENERRSEADRRLAMLGQMSAVLAHEIRNPLASLKGHAQLLEERLDAGSVDHRKAARVVEEARRLENITNDLLDLVRSGPMDIRSVSPAEVARASVADLGGRTVTIDDARAPERWLLDERRFRLNVLGNLLRNAVEASPPDRPPQVRITEQEGKLVFTIRDFGPGLPEGSESRLFDPFFTTRVTGTGLGLSLARRIVDLHGGEIRAANAPDGGAVFTVEIPAMEHA